MGRVQKIVGKTQGKKPAHHRRPEAGAQQNKRRSQQDQDRTGDRNYEK